MGAEPSDDLASSVPRRELMLDSVDNMASNCAAGSVTIASGPDWTAAPVG